MAPMNARYSPEDLAGLLDQHAPTEEQSAVISAPLQPRLVVAGAGSGKTATMSDRVVWLVANGFVAPDQVLGVTFTRKAAGELAQRINRKLDLLTEAGLDLPAGAEGADAEEGMLTEGAARASVSTYHSYANTLVRDHGMRIGLEPDTGMIGEAQSYQIMSRIVRAYAGDLSFANIAASSLVSGAIKLAGDCAEHLVEPDQVQAYLAEQSRFGESLPYDVAQAEGSHADVAKIFSMLRLRRVMAELVVSYRRATLDAGVMDFGDLVRFAARIAQEVPAVGEIERSRYRVVLLDEFQDTSHAQLELFRGLYGTAGHPVTAVGDPHQSIYGFRGASAGQLFAFPGLFSVPRAGGGADPAPVSYLTTAWRNSHTILAAANTVAGPLRSEPVGGIQVKPLTASPIAVDGEVRAAWLPDSEQEAAAVVAALKEAGGAGGEGRTPAQRPTRAILCRTRSQFEPLMEAMDLAGVPYEVLGLSGLLSVPEVADVIAVLQVISDPSRSDHLMRLMTGARWRIGTADLVVLQGRAATLERNRRHTGAAQDPQASDGGPDLDQDTSPEEDAESASLIEALDWLPDPGWTDAAGRGFSAAGRERLERLSRELRYLSGQTGLELTALIRLVETTLGLDIEVAARPGQSGITARRHLDGFLDAARDFTQGAVEGSGADLTAFLAWLQAAEEREKGLGMAGSEPSHEAVQLLTAHASKGLEWDIVAVPGLVDGQFPGKTVDTWTSEKAGHLPWTLRGDANSLPHWNTDWSNQRDWAGHAVGWSLKRQKDEYPDSYKDRAAAHHLEEERRLAYVAFTRARSLLLLSGSHWRGVTKTPSTPSPFLDELMESTDGVDVVTGPWAPPEDMGEENPFAQRKLVAWWPFDPLDGPEVLVMDPEAPDDLEQATALPPRSRPRREAVQEAARWVRSSAPLRTGLDAEEPKADGPADGGATHDLARQVEWVLERSAPVNHRGRLVELPGHVSASTFVALADDPEAVARQLRRPMPRPPAHAARRGTAFHAWVEDHFGATGMLDFDDPEDSADHWVEDALDLEPMKRSFLASRWADRLPAYIEPPVETTVGGVALRGRIDAVFREGGAPEVPNDPEARWELVDWKTGAVPTGRDLKIKSLQLAVYRLAWSRLHRIPLENISASFVYVAHGVEKSVHDLAGEDELETILAAAVAPQDG
ncbi:ATP-dependent DNA helicase [Citricoccus sp. NPDC055426]|uniref:ATP-dependent helicase n=1 Tax=Citricoccus sp. NPDC055426 TaxID=3155536 RepID=UPI00342DB81B